MAKLIVLEFGLSVGIASIYNGLYFKIKGYGKNVVASLITSSLRDMICGCGIST